MHFQGWDPEKNPLPLCQRLYKEGNKNKRRFAS